MRYPMRAVTVAALFAVVAAGCSGQAQSPAQAQQAADSARALGALYGIVPAAPAVYELEDAFLRWPLPAGAEKYGAIDGKRIHPYVVDQVNIARRYRDQGHQFWGRIIGTSADEESVRWLMDKFRQIGLADVHVVSHGLDPQWLPRSWEVSVSGSGQTRRLESAQPTYQTVATPSEGVDLEAVYVGTGSEADFSGRNVRGKAAFIFSMPLPGGTRPMANAEGATQRAADKGAAAIFLIIAQPGNMKTQLYPTRTNVPTFALGMQDGYAVRDLIGQAPNQPPRVHIRLDVELVPNLETATVFGTLPGTTDETIYINAHRDGWFDAAGDNASGVAAMVALAEYYAKVPRAQRRRTLIFAGLTGHHNGVNRSVEWFTEHRDSLFAKTALLINSEHPSTLQTYLYWEDIRWSNTYTAQFWYAGGPSRPKLQDIAIQAFRDFGVPTYSQPERQGPPGDLSVLWRFAPGVTTSDFNMYFHMDAETPETVPWTGLEASTRAYAKILDEVNKLDLADLKRPEAPPLTAGR